MVENLDEKDLEKKLYIVRMYDGFDSHWIDITEPLPISEAEERWNEKTEHGTEHTHYETGGHYYKIFPADTEMLYRVDRP